LDWLTEFAILLLASSIGFYLGSRYRIWREEFVVEIIGAAGLLVAGMIAFAYGSLIIPYTSLLLAWLAGTISGHHHRWILRRFGIRDTL
jgi:CHASE2 domain-containing sensor protein